MKVFAVLACIFAVASAGAVLHSAIPATTIVRAPSHDSAVIRSDRLGGNFAYSVAENHAYAAVSPVVQHVATPVAVSYSAPAVHAVAGPAVYAGHHAGLYAGHHAGYLGYSGLHGAYGYGYGLH